MTYSLASGMLERPSAQLINSETQRFRLDPIQSYVDAATKAKDPKFWSPGANP